MVAGAPDRPPRRPALREAAIMAAALFPLVAAMHLLIFDRSLAGALVQALVFTVPFVAVFVLVKHSRWSR